MKILYLHGWGTKYSAKNPKVSALKSIATVVGVSINYARPIGEVSDLIRKTVEKEKPDLILGSSLGGWWASFMSVMKNIPFVAINPSLQPQHTLRRVPTSGIDYAGREYMLSPETIDAYTNFLTAGTGLVILDLGDEFLDAYETKLKLENRYEIIAFPGGSHRFDHIYQSLDSISAFYQKVSNKE